MAHGKCRIPIRPSSLTICLLLALLAAAFFAAPPSRGADNRFNVVSQMDWGNKLGFYIDFENSSQGDAPCRLDTLKLILGVSDGSSWRFLFDSPTWVYGRRYTIHATISPSVATISLDGSIAQSSPGGFKPDENIGLLAAAVPNWASGPAEYEITETTLRITTSAGKSVSLDFPQPTRGEEALSLFSGAAEKDLPNWRLGGGESITIDASLTITPGRWQDFAPMVDRYGQCVYANWPGKVTEDVQVQRSSKFEAMKLAEWGVPKGYDKFGGSTALGWKEKATGFYCVSERNGVWWLISPLGNPCFYTGVCNAPAVTDDFTPVSGREALFSWLPPKTGAYAAAWNAHAWGQDDGGWDVSFHAATDIRLLGADWQAKDRALAVERIRAWGFSGVGKWDSVDGLPYVPVLYAGVPTVGGHPDIFDPGIQKQFHDSIESQIMPHLNDPYVVGWSIGNEFDEIITNDNIEAMLNQGAEVPAKRALVDFALRTLYGGNITRMAAAWQVSATTLEELYAATPKPPAADIEPLRHFFADHYYDFFCKTVKSIDPNHLYLGFWIVPGWWQNSSDWSLIARHCDVIGFDHYANDFGDDDLEILMRSSNKPVLCGEFSYPPFYDGQRAFGRYYVWSSGDAQAGDHYARYVKEAALNPYCVGTLWFEYRDEPITGRGPGHGPNLVYSEDYAFGLIDETNRPKWDLVTRVRAANLAADRWRLEAH